MDTLRADHLGIYGYARARTANIDSFADRGTAFLQISSQIPLTLPSHFSLLTSTYPFANRVQENAQQVPANTVTLPSVLRARGYRTAAFIGAIYLERELGFDQGFDFYDSPFRFEAFSSLSGSMFFGDRNRNPLHARDRRDGALVVRAAVQWLNANRDKPLFALVHLFDLHQPYRLPPSSVRRPGISDYDAELEAIDQVVGSFRQALIRNGLWDRSLVILLSDHGESLGEHGEQTHGYFIYQSTLHVPLVVHWPLGAPARATSTARPAGLIDVAPTILDFLHIPAPPSFAGRSLLPSLDSANADAPPVYSESDYTHDAFGWSALHSLRAGRYKYVAAPRAELYDLERDPRERDNVIATHPAETRSLQAQLSALLARYTAARPAASGAVPPERLAALKSLGYIGPGPRSALGASGIDPKDRLAEYRLYEQAQHELMSGRAASSIALLRQIVKRDPRNMLACRDIGVAYNAQGLYPKARANLRQVVAAAPGDFVARFELGLADEHFGFFSESLEQLRAACRIAPEADGCRRELDAVQHKVEEGFP